VLDYTILITWIFLVRISKKRIFKYRI